ncbi:methyltransferase domain-containing protein [Pseudophaeobacter sp.]|uniref:methyltransferase domain-containing protein n=1 Tax=Pseudophaeobacter sp. TaxID=1971739 RepID=UPI00262F434B|nr:methyltransferase domain-containing protein [Pseudophaeobacter sp.]
MNANSVYQSFLVSKDYFDSLAVFSDGPLHPGAAGANDWLFGGSDLTGLRLLEIGLGTGWTHRYLSMLGADVVSIEPNNLMRQRSLEAGVQKSRVLSMRAEDLTEAEVAQSGPFDGLVVQAVTGFLDGGLGMIERLFRLSGARRLWLAEWYGAALGKGSAPLRAHVDLGEFVTSAADLGLMDLRLHLGQDPAKPATLSRAEHQLQAVFPEASEFGGQTEALAKIHRDFDLRFEGMKPFLWLDAS